MTRDEPTAILELTELEIATTRLALAVFAASTPDAARSEKALKAKTLQGMADLARQRTQIGGVTQ